MLIIVGSIMACQEESNMAPSISGEFHTGDYIYLKSRDINESVHIRVIGRVSDDIFAGYISYSPNEGAICDTINGMDNMYRLCIDNECQDLCQ